ncbi:hypothetical protein D9615_006523 [Tricholomella constricta]|uniref:Uncharacterized protein n=1 Tax=Tricholomella constricta TaxID=117010 RepID=A0A8H5HA05_9AGAR|nr:hypothetical protein D9615_006523 [Tricholomella constricta]
MSVELDPTIDFIAGTISASFPKVWLRRRIASITSEELIILRVLVKVRFQNPETSFKYRSTVHAVTTIVREERFVGLYKGITSPLLEHPDALPSLTQITLAELIKIRQQSCLQRTSTRRVALQIFRESGLPGLYRGITATALRDTGYGAYFLAYEATCRFLAASQDGDALPSSGTNLHWPSLLLAGGMAGVFGWLATFPFDVVKTRMQGTDALLPPPTVNNALTPLLGTTTPTSNVNTLRPPPPPSLLTRNDTHPYRTTLSTIVNSYRADGLRVFYRGLAPTLIRAVPVNMVTFATFETVVQALS